MSNGNSGALDNASKDANQNLSSAPAGSPSQSCGSPATPDDSVSVSPGKTHWIAIELVDDEQNAVPFEDYKITLPDGTVVEGTLDKKGRAKVTGLDSGSCKVSFPNLDQEIWNKS